MFLFFKQKTAYELRISDWSSDVCSSDLIGVKAGDSVQVAFVAGRDGCNGFDGWYVDNVELEVCEAVATMSAVHVPEPSRYGQASDVTVTLTSGAGTVPTGKVTVKIGSAHV